jgi:hypothetical protein
MSHEHELIQTFPSMFPGPRHNVSYGVGWHPILLRLCAATLGVDPTVQVGQIKEKFGGLRFYILGCSDQVRTEIYDLIAKAERESFRTCEKCGQPGNQDGGGWIRTLCEECRNA